MRKEWTNEEEIYMERRYLYQPVEKTANKLCRSINSVKRKASKMGLNHYADNLNAKTIARCFSVDVSVIIRWINKFDLPCRKIECKNQTRYIIDVDKFWKWAETNKEIINWRKYERRMLFPEPKWLDEAIKNCMCVNSRKKYTEHEIAEVKNLLHKGLSYKEIANQLNRNYYGISHLCRKIYN